jgi:MFS transporter, DHA1 family, multidrug resistance protein
MLQCRALSHQKEKQLLLMKEGLKPTILSALVLALASFGDAFLYPVLPVNAAQMGVPLIWVGFLLSINRFIRLMANQVFGWLFNTFGYRRITILAAVFAAISTFCYGLATGLVIWIAARIVWGLCYSSLRISCISYSLESKNPGFLLGLSRGLQETGPILALLIGPFLMKYVSVQTTFLIFSGLSVSAIILACYLPELPKSEQSFVFSFNPIPSSFNALVFLSALVVEGMLVVLIGKLFVSGQLSALELTAITAFYIGYRRFSNVFVSPLAGRLADRFGIERIFLIAIFLTIFSLLVLVSGYVKIGLLLTFTLQSISSALAPGAAINQENRLKAIAANATWRDLGSAAGALLGGSLLMVDGVSPYLFFSTLILSGALLIHLILSKQFKHLIKWR